MDPQATIQLISDSAVTSAAAIFSGAAAFLVGLVKILDRVWPKKTITRADEVRQLIVLQEKTQQELATLTAMFRESQAFEAKSRDDTARAMEKIARVIESHADDERELLRMFIRRTADGG